VTIQLRYLQTLSEVGVNQNSTIVFPLPMDLITPMLEAAKEVQKALPEGESVPVNGPAQRTPRSAG
jgi:hypothetical protein